MTVKVIVVFLALVLFAVWKVDSQCTTVVCDGKQDSSMLTMLATVHQGILDILSKTYEIMANRPSWESRPKTCAEIQALGFNSSSVYTVYYFEGNIWVPVRVYCDMETAGGGWLVFQRRFDGEEDFFRNWTDYFDGFGDLDSEFWLGNYYLHMLTSGGQYKLRIDLADFEGETRYAEFSSFSVGRPRDKFVLSVSGYSGNSGDSFGNPHNELRFSTKDRDHDNHSGGSNCAEAYKGGWWYGSCHDSNLNGLYLSGIHTSYANGIEWNAWKGMYYSLKFVEMKFKPY